MASVRSIDSALGITLTDNGRIMRNLIHGADTVMSHILHFYHLAAADFVDISALGSPWDDGSGGPAFGVTTGAAQLVSLVTTNALNKGATHELVESYVEALNIRKEAHTMAAIFSGRHPIQNAIVPGGVSTLYTASDVADFRTRLTKVRNFINGFYIPDVVFAATRTGLGWGIYWNVGSNPGTLLSYGEYPAGNAPFDGETDANNMLISRGVVNWTAGGGSTEAFNITNIKEYVDYSFYSSPSGLPPATGVTTPLTDAALQTALTSGPQYSWLKAPRYNGRSAEVGPLARMLATTLFGNTTTVSDTSSGVLSLNSVLTIPTVANYTAAQLVTQALSAVSGLAGGGIGVPQLWSPLGRHAARALECKYVADAMDSWLNQLTYNHAAVADGITNPIGPQTTNTTTLGQYTTTVATGSGYTYVQIPKATKSGAGLAEAPRGALGHWITISSKKIASYQCVVPTTWNACPKANLAGNGYRGPAESALVGIPAGTGNNAVCNIARMLHPYDFCIACAVHVVTPEGKEIAKFKMDLDGKVTTLPVDSE